MNLHPKVLENKHYIILGGVFIGILALLGVLPETTDVADLGYNVKYIWAACMLASGILYYMIYMEKNTAPRQQGQPQQQPQQPQTASPQVCPQMPSMPPMAPPSPQSPQQLIRDQVQESIRKQNLKNNIAQTK